MLRHRSRAKSTAPVLNHKPNAVGMLDQFHTCALCAAVTPNVSQRFLSNAIKGLLRQLIQAFCEQFGIILNCDTFAASLCDESINSSRQSSVVDLGHRQPAQH